MFGDLGRFAGRRRRWIMVGTLLIIAFAAVWGTGVFGRLGGGAGFDDPGSPSAHADRVLAGPLGRHANDVVVLYESDRLTVDDPAFAGPVQKALAGVPRGDVTRLDSYWSTGSSSYVSGDRHATYAAVQLRSADDQERVLQLRKIQDSFRADGLTVRFGGTTSMTDQVNRQTLRDLAIAEAISIPVLLILLIVIFRSLLAATLPLVIGLTAALGSLALLRFVTFFTDISTFAIQVITILGLGLAIDYALLAVTRFREELSAGATVEAAVERTMATAGRTIAFSGAVVAVSFAGLTLFPSRFLLSMGYAGAGTVVVAVLASLTVLPALLTAMGRRLNPARARTGDPAAGRWYRTAHAVMRRPWRNTVVIVVVLGALGLPFLGVNWARPGDWVLPSNADARVVTQVMSERFAADPGKLVTAVVESPRPAGRAALEAYAARLDGVPGIEGAAVTGTDGGRARITLGYSMDPMSRDARRMVADLRAVAPPEGATTSFTGMPASRADIVDMVTSRLPWMALFATAVSFVVLFLALGSVVLPIKSVLLNLLSLGAAFGAIKLVFQDGLLNGLLGLEAVGAVDVNFPVLIVAIAFGLAVDYEVFLLSRVREEYDRTGDVAESTALGLQRTGRVITSAALLVAVVVGGFALSGIVFMKMAGVGLVIAVVVDAFVVRALLVPATMRLLGRWAWWAPAPLARWWRRRGAAVHGHAVPPSARPAEVAHPT
ncbi:MMPL family transporter [Planotetraspora kaengkrachanensis]|uniref:Membrane protein n=1 Tax=Planotetraspora kaengkrachanensis TaxID=575193 RepID=A0A8J3LUU5_9ACTN|nr:MMPL family transporter [Planotetraspora kaengkrachanensis]GIG76918.1 membrane protein [Planotetraspora kaengkrachanensis]